MADAPEGIDIATMLAPIPGDAPAGVDLREDFSPQSIYYRLRDARAEARQAERMADANPGEETAAPPQWRTIRDLSVTALEGKTKDVELASWLTESMVRDDGLRGLAAGARLICGLAETFWENNLYPMPDEDGIATRVAPVTGLNGEGGDGTLIQPLRKLFLCQRPDGEPLLYYQYEEAEKVAGIAEAARKQARLDAGALKFEEVEAWARARHTQFAPLKRAVVEAEAAWQAMTGALDAKAGVDSPPTSRVRDLLAQIRAVIDRYAPADVEAGPDAEAAGGVAGESGGGPAVAGVVGASTRLVTREDMLRELSRIAEWFRKTEPHSPLAYTLDEAVRRGRMTWPDLLAEIVSDPTSRHAILNSLGIRPPDDTGGY
jgi:type VI secretion system protein ImpA